MKRKAKEQGTPIGKESTAESTLKKQLKKAKSEITAKAKLHDTFVLETTLERSKAKSDTSNIEDETPSSQ